MTRDGPHGRPVGPRRGRRWQPTPAVASEQEVDRLLARRARAIRGRPAPGFLDTASPGPGSAGAGELLRGPRELPVASAAYEVSPIDRVDGRDVTRVATQLLVRLDGFDPRPVAASHVLELEQGEQGWRVVRTGWRPPRYRRTVDPGRCPVRTARA